MTFKVDLNCDLGEYQSSFEERKEVAIMPLISSANIACGRRQFHTDNDTTSMGIWRWYWSSSIVSRSRKFWPESHGFA